MTKSDGLESGQFINGLERSQFINGLERSQYIYMVLKETNH